MSFDQNLPFTRVQLDPCVCACGECAGILYVSGKCHPANPVIASYDKKTGLLTLACAVCEKPIVKILVARDLIE